MRIICKEYKSKMLNCRHSGRVKLKRLNSEENFSPLNRIAFIKAGCFSVTGTPEMKIVYDNPIEVWFEFQWQLGIEVDIG